MPSGTKSSDSEPKKGSESAPRKKRPRAKSFLTRLGTQLGLKARIFVVGLALGVGATLFLQHYNPLDRPSESQIVAASVVFERIVAQNELVSVAQTYNITEKAESATKIPGTDIVIPFTDNSFWYRYVGTIKAGVNLETAEFAQSEDVITVTLDSPAIIANTPNMEKSGVLEERNNIFNPIHIEDVDAFLAKCVEQSESQALEGGLMDEARANTEANIGAMFNAALGDECELRFDWRDE